MVEKGELKLQGCLKATDKLMVDPWTIRYAAATPQLI